MSADPPYFSAREAADYCGVSEKTVRNWLASGRLEAVKSAGSFRIAREQLEPLRRKSAPQPASADRQSADVLVSGADLLQLVREAQADAMAKAEAAAMWQARAEMLAGQLQQRDEQLKALMAPKEEPAAPAGSVATTPVFQDYPSQEPRPQPWWRRWFW
jgi:excisionase family DNA binding protein